MTIFNGQASSPAWLTLLSSLLNFVAGAGLAMLAAHQTDARRAAREQKTRSKAVEARTMSVLATVINLGMAADEGHKAGVPPRSIGEHAYLRMLAAVARVEEGTDDVFSTFGEDLGFRLIAFFDGLVLSASTGAAIERELLASAGKTPPAQEASVLANSRETLILAGKRAAQLLLDLKGRGRKPRA